MDYEMPEINGAETTDMIRTFLCNQNIEQPIIAGVTGHSDQKFFKIAFESGMNIVFEKTLIPDKVLKELINNCDIKIA